MGQKLRFSPSGKPTGLVAPGLTTVLRWGFGPFTDGGYLNPTNWQQAMASNQAIAEHLLEADADLSIFQFATSAAGDFVVDWTIEVGGESRTVRIDYNNYPGYDAFPFDVIPGNEGDLVTIRGDLVSGNPTIRDDRANLLGVYR